MIIAVDGPAGAGKSTACRMLARELGYAYLDTGSMYRAVAWALLGEHENLEEELIARHLPQLPLSFSIENGALSISYRGQKLETELRQPEISQQASRISQYKSVRNFLTHWQQELAAHGKIVAEGRDMTTVVFPDAPVKVYLTADLSTRTQRRQAEYQEKGISVEYAALEAQIHNRDEADAGRLLAPLRPAPGAVVIDTSKLQLTEVVKVLLQLVSEKGR